ncbi:membrane protein insertase YidC [Psychroflexus planctonicus]|uniref:Membrane protein insertase YidC n=1 Tax=Psychroflexus planctonicus TaxID=1526575 RepID=A0ABQ1SLR7_9FLAO|nr:membrane protein insertase YidC [Psychroflexus planctonicus]GGE42933.1 membrane protein insertase YidC [Psychroflexus planctonicus]
MEENKKFDVNSLIGFVLIGIILFWMLYMNQDPESEQEQTTTEQVEENKTDTLQQNSQTNNLATPTEEASSTENDSIAQLIAQQQLGAFAYAEMAASNKDGVTEISNDVLRLKVSNRGGQIIEAEILEYETYDGKPIYLIKDGNANFSIDLHTKDGKKLATKDLYFEPSLSQEGEDQVLQMKLKASEENYLAFEYRLKPDDYMMDFNIRSQGLNQVLNTSEEPMLHWQIKAYRLAKSISYENQYSEIIFKYEGNKDDYTNQREQTEEEGKDVDWVAFRQHFFSSILLADSPFQRGKFISENLVQDEQVDTVFTKNYKAELALQLEAGEFTKGMNFYYGPTDIKILREYERDLDIAVPLGWGIFGWINKYLFIPFFGFLSGVLPSYGLAIIIMTIVVRIVLSPITYKSYLSQAKMKVLRPEIDELNKKYKDNAMKKQQETMKLYSKTGVSPLSGCIPALLQIPVFYALFRFFPSAFDLRQKGFLWADDLSSYDVIFEWDAYIPLISWVYGNHVSLFPILASVAIFFYMRMTTGQNMQQMSQPGMPNMKVIMYISPLVMLVFFNNYASGLSLYYFISNLITIGIMLVIKKVIIDEDKILAKIEMNKKKPKKKGKFARKMQQIMEQAEEQKRKNQK